MAKKKPDLIYVEPDNYFPKDILKKYFPEVFEYDKDFERKEKESVVAKPENNMTIGGKEHGAYLGIYYLGSCRPDSK